MPWWLGDIIELSSPASPVIKGLKLDKIIIKTHTEIENAGEKAPMILYGGIH